MSNISRSRTSNSQNFKEVEQELRQGLEEQLDQLAIYFQVELKAPTTTLTQEYFVTTYFFQAVEKESPGLVPIGLLVH